MKKVDTPFILDVSGMFDPGVYKIEFVPKKRAYFGIASSSLFLDLEEFVNHLKKGDFENKQWINDFKFYGFDQFDIQVVVIGPEYYDETKLNQALEKAKTDWLGELY